nr:MAG: hypothetical protein [Hemigrapsus takanoi nimavirus]
MALSDVNLRNRAESDFRDSARKYLTGNAEGRKLITDLKKQIAMGIIYDVKATNLTKPKVLAEYSTDIVHNIMSSQEFKKQIAHFIQNDTANEDYKRRIKALFDRSIDDLAGFGICNVRMDLVTGEAYDPDDFQYTPIVAYGFDIQRVEKKCVVDGPDALSPPDNKAVLISAEGQPNTNRGSTYTTTEFKDVTLLIKNNTDKDRLVYCKAHLQADPAVNTMIFDRDFLQTVTANGGRLDYKIAMPMLDNHKYQAKAEGLITVIVA